MYLKELEITGFKSFAKKSVLKFNSPISSIVGPNGSGKSNIAEAFRFVLGEQSLKSMRGKKGEDLIFNGTHETGKSNHARVKVVLDNSDKKLNIDFEEVALERVVYKDGVNEYFINGSLVRLKDIIELLAGANIGSSGHHIISQGEADRILNTSPKERKVILEEALGLRIFQFKKIESEKKLEKTKENIKQVESLRREISPHIKYLEKQIQKIETVKNLKSKLEGFYLEYLKREDLYLTNLKQKIEENVRNPRIRIDEINQEIKSLEEAIKESGNNELALQIKKLEVNFTDVQYQKTNLLKEEGRIEGEINSLEKIKARTIIKENSAISIDRKEFDEIKEQVLGIEKETEQTSDVLILKNLTKKFFDLIKILFKKSENENSNTENDLEILEAKKKLTEITKKLEEITKTEIDLKNEIFDLRQKLESDKSNSLQIERKIVSLMSEKNDLQQIISQNAVALDNYNRDSVALKQELTEGVVLVGRQILEYKEANIDAEINPDEDRSKQLERRKELERMKIRIEELGTGSAEDTVKEYEEVVERDKFLLKEIEDLEKSSVSLMELIVDLELKIENKFKEGIEKINKEFQNFFSLMFGGGFASIKVIKSIPRRKKETFNLEDEGQILESADQEETEEGIDININLPRKKVKGLMMLSGGERALTSIALIFAMSQVNPPPFIILDETDAALDEANSRKYGDMIENLSKNSQLILITHNRETMSRANILYGVTMQKGISQLLSISFEKGVEWAK